MKQISIIALIVLILIQWYIPGKIIWDKKDILKSGKVFRFRTEPIDPSNPFVGKYVQLNFKEDEFVLREKKNFKQGQEIFVVLENDANGFAKIAQVLESPPANDIDFVMARVQYVMGKVQKDSPEVERIKIDYPFDQYYMDEYKAPKAEKLYSDVSRDSTQKIYAIVHVLNGRAVISDVMINEKPIREAIGKGQ